MIKFITAFFCIIGLLLASCNKSTKNETLTNSSADSLKIQLLMLNDSVSFYWKNISVADSQKFADVDRLLDEVSYSKRPDEVKLAILRMKYKSLLDNKLTQELMLVSDNIDKNDILVDSIIQEVVVFASTTPHAEDYPLIATLIDDISTANSADAMVVNRVKYDKAAFLFNALIEQNKDKLNLLDEKLRTLKPTFAVQKPQL